MAKSDTTGALKRGFTGEFAGKLQVAHSDDTLDGLDLERTALSISGRYYQDWEFYQLCLDTKREFEKRLRELEGHRSDAANWQRDLCKAVIDRLDEYIAPLQEKLEPRRSAAVPQ